MNSPKGNITMLDLAALLLRLGLGAMFIAHSLWLKLFVFTLPGTAQFFGSIGLPPALAYLVFAAEAIGGVALILGIATRAVALALIPVLLGATGPTRATAGCSPTTAAARSTRCS
jgi:putative oxidoreductase